ncbi:MAG: VWA domain-containing protein [Acidobacteria bacterium]|nr:MAG: VWA domain-containing protein [Acidobacteriota bacterium]
MRVSLVLALAATLTAAVTAQQSTFKSTTALVEVDVTVLDKQGKFVPGLQADDLVLYEDGKLQKIQQFYMVAHDPSRLGAAQATVGLSRSEAEERARRFFVFFIDEGSLSAESLMRVKKGAENFIDRQMLPGDMAGVFVNGQMNKSRMTDDKIELLGAIRSATPAIDNRQALLAPFREFPRIPSENDALRVTEGARELLDELGRRACLDNAMQCEIAGGTNAVENLIQQKARLYVRSARVLTENSIENLKYVSANLARLIGRKTIVMMTEGMFSDESRPQLQQLAAQAARGGTTIYTIDGRGLVNTMSANPDVVYASRARSEAGDTGDDGPNILTSGTGGMMVRGIDDIGRAIGMVANDTSSYYVIGYAPENAVMDGKYRTIEVKSTASGLQIRARKGYLAVNLPPQEFIRKAGYR